MRLFVWESVENVSDSWHDGGGVVALATSLDAARSVIRGERPTCTALTEEPTSAVEVGSALLGDVVWFFPDAGCC